MNEGRSVVTEPGYDITNCDRDKKDEKPVVNCLEMSLAMM